jgi:hypothetical protein
MQYSAAKYSGGIETLGHEKLLHTEQTFFWQRPEKLQPKNKNKARPLEAAI